MFLQQYAEVAWVDREDGTDKAIVRFKDGQQEALVKGLAVITEEKKEIGGKTPTSRLLEGEEEETHWKGVFDARASSSKGGRGRGRGRGGRGGRGRGNKRKR